MVKIILGILICLSYSMDIYAQPGWAYKLQGNLNEIDSTQIKNCIKDCSQCYFGMIEIDSTTDLRRLNHLNCTPNLTLNIYLKSLPKEFSTVYLDNITSLYLGAEQLIDISNFPIMNNLEELTIRNFKGDSLKINNTLPNLNTLEITNFNSVVNIKADNLETLILSEFQGNILKIKNAFPNLKELKIHQSDKIVNIDSVLINNNIEALSIIKCNGLSINLNDISFNNLRFLRLLGAQSFKFKWEDLIQFKKLESIDLDYIDFESIPENFSTNLKRISITSGNTNLETLNKLSRLENVIDVRLTNISINWKK